MKLLMENWRKFLNEDPYDFKPGDARDAELVRMRRIGSGEWTKEDKEWVLFTFEDEIEDFEEAYGRKPRKTEVAQYLQEKSVYYSSGRGNGVPTLYHNQPGRPLYKQIGLKKAGLKPEPLRLYDIYKSNIKHSILPLEGKSGFEKWAERAEREAGGKPGDIAKEMVDWMRHGATISDHPHGIEAGLADAQVGTILRLTHLTPDNIFQNMEVLVKSGKSAEQAAQDISSTDEGATRTNPNYDPNEGPSMDNPDFDEDEDESDENPKRIKNPRTIPMVIADPKIILRMYKYYKAAGL
jgi:hypothetical protein